MSTSTTTAATKPTSISSTTSAATAFAGLGLVDLDLLSIESDSIHLTDSSLCRVLVLECYKGITFAGVVDVGNWPKLLEFGLNKIDVIKNQFNKINSSGVERIFKRGHAQSNAHANCNLYRFIALKTIKAKLTWVLILQIRAPKISAPVGGK